MSQLRSSAVLDPLNTSKLTSHSQLALPPSFYEDDVIKFKKKFQQSIENRKEFKSVLKKKLF